MGIFSRKAPKWGKLSDKQKAFVTHRMIKAMSSGGYKVVDSPDVFNRQQGVIERTGEDGILDMS